MNNYVFLDEESEDEFYIVYADTLDEAKNKLIYSLADEGWTKEAMEHQKGWFDWYYRELKLKKVLE